MIVPVYEEQMPAFISIRRGHRSDGLTWQVPEAPYPDRASRFWRSFTSLPEKRLSGLHTKFGAVGVYICYDRHFPKCARAGNETALKLFQSSRRSRLSEHLWELRTGSRCDGYFVGAINALAARSRGISEVLMARVTFAIRAAKSSPQPAARR